MKKQQIITTVVAALVALPLSFSLAQDEDGKGKGKGRPGGKGGFGGGKGGPGGFTQPKFADIDTDASGDVSKEEWIAHSVKMAEERAERSFGFIAGDDEKISEEELKRVMARMGQRGGGKGGPGGPGQGGGPGTGKGKGKGPGGEKRDSEAGGGTKPKRPEVEE